MWAKCVECQKQIVLAPLRSKIQILTTVCFYVLQI